MNTRVFFPVWTYRSVLLNAFLVIAVLQVTIAPQRTWAQASGQIVLQVTLSSDVLGDTPGVYHVRLTVSDGFYSTLAEYKQLFIVEGKAP